MEVVTDLFFHIMIHPSETDKGKKNRMQLIVRKGRGLRSSYDILNTNLMYV